MVENELEALATIARTTGVDFDRAHASEAIRHAERDVPGDPAEMWSHRMEQAGKDLGLRLQSARRSSKEALKMVHPSTPVATRITAEDGSTQWLVVADREGRRVRLASPERDQWISRGHLKKLLGVQNLDQTLTWIFAQPLSPLEGAKNHDDEHGHHGSMPPLSRLIWLLRPEWRDLRVVLIFAVGVGLLMLATPIAVESLVMMVQFGGLIQPIIVLSLILFGCLALASAMYGLQTYVVEIIQRRLFVRVAADLAHRLPRVRSDAYDHHNGPELVNRFFDVMTVQKSVASLVLDGVAIVIQALIGLLVLAFYHPYLLGFDLVLVGAVGFAIFVLGRGAITTSIEQSRAKYAVAAGLEELARNPQVFKHSGGPAMALDRTDHLALHYLDKRIKHFRIVFRQILFALGLQAVASTALLGLGGWLVISNQLTLGQLVASELIVATILASFAKMGKHIQGYYDLLAAVDKLGHLIDLPLESLEGETHSPTPNGASLRLNNVSYGYGHGSHQRAALHHISFAVEPGERVAVVGRSGSGKSTLVDLLFGLRTPSEGTIELDGADLREIRLDSLREQVALVKGLEIVETSVLENVRMGRDELSVGDIRRALEAVGLMEEVRSLPEGLNTHLMANGTPMSLGQAKRLMLAQAIAGRPRLLILDEAIEGLDVESKRKVLATLLDPEAPWTLLVVTHNPDLAEQFGRILVLSGGQAALVESKKSNEIVPTWQDTEDDDSPE